MNPVERLHKMASEGRCVSFKIPSGLALVLEWSMVDDATVGLRDVPADELELLMEKVRASMMAAAAEIQAGKRPDDGFAEDCAIWLAYEIAHNPDWQSHLMPMPPIPGANSRLN